ncbi:MAG: hypothetical protein ACK5MI_06360 [Mangrovibacterium sp.]
MPKTPEQRIMELESALALEKKKNKRLEKEAERANKKVILFDMMIDVAEE